MRILNFQRWKLPPSNFSMTFKDSIWKEDNLNTNATTNTLLKRLKVVEEIFDTSHKVEKETSNTCNNEKNSLWHTWNSILSTSPRPLLHKPQTFNESKDSLPHFFLNFKVEIINNSKNCLWNTLTLKLDSFKNLEEQVFSHLKKLTTFSRNLFQTSHSLGNGQPLSL
jgi:hypothetical protein